MRYVTLPETVDGLPIVKTHRTADREEVTGCVMEHVPEMAPVMVPERATVTFTTTHPDGSIEHGSYERDTGQMVPDQSGATAPTGSTVEQLVDPGGALRLYNGEKLVKEYALGDWQSCSENPPHFQVDVDERDFD